MQEANKCIEVQKDGASIFYVYCLDKEHDIKIEHKFEGTIIKIDLSKRKPLDKKYYFRFRVKSNNMKDISHEYKPSNSFMESAFTKLEIVDFKINEMRNLQLSLIEEIGAQTMCLFHCVKLFLVRQAYYEFAYSDKPIKNSRIVENDIWSNYVGDRYTFERMLVYYWKVGEDKKPDANTKISEGYSSLAKFKYEENNWTTILIFLVVVVLIGTFSGVLGNYCSAKINKRTNLFDATFKTISTGVKR